MAESARDDPPAPPPGILGAAPGRAGRGLRLTAPVRPVVDNPVPGRQRLARRPVGVVAFRDSLVDARSLCLPGRGRLHRDLNGEHVSRP